MSKFMMEMYLSFINDEQSVAYDKERRTVLGSDKYTRKTDKELEDLELNGIFTSLISLAGLIALIILIVFVDRGAVLLFFVFPFVPFVGLVIDELLDDSATRWFCKRVKKHVSKSLDV